MRMGKTLLGTGVWLRRSVGKMTKAIATAILARTGVQAQQHTLSIRDVLTLIETGQPRLRAYKDQAAAAGDNGGNVEYGVGI